MALGRELRGVAQNGTGPRTVRRSWVGHAATLSVLPLLWLHTAAQAQPHAASQLPTDRPVVALLAVEVDGLPASAALAFAQQLEAALAAPAYWLVSPTRVHERLLGASSWSGGCLAGPCLSAVRTQTGAVRAVTASLRGHGTSFGYVLTVLETELGSVIVQRTEQCHVCTVEDAMEQTLAAAKALAGAPLMTPRAAPFEQARAREPARSVPEASPHITPKTSRNTACVATSTS